MIKRDSKPNQNPSTNRSEGQKPEMDNDLHELFLDELADVYSAEQQLVKALPKMVKAAQSDELRQAFESHLEETRGHVTRLQELAKALDESLENKTCAAMQGLIKEAGELMEEQKDSTALDAALIAAGQKVEHYEMASYATLITWAEEMGHEEAVKVLTQTLEEEEAADEKLSSIARSNVNPKAKAE
jgi:ferritin-like metal-binding protein YciE